MSGSLASDGKGDRDVISAFLELSVPLAQQMEAGLTTRFDDYSDFGSATSYGISYLYSPVSVLKLRANYGTSFKAPPLAYLYNKTDGGYLDVNDPKFCNSGTPAADQTCQGRTSYATYVNLAGNKELQEETAQAYNFGFILEPADFLSFSADVWDVQIKDIQNSEDLAELVQKEIEGADLGASTVTRVNDPEDPLLGKISRIDNSYYNLGTLRTRGIDLEANFDWKFDTTRTGVDVQYSNVLSRREKRTLNSEETEKVGRFGLPRYKTKTTLWGQWGDHRVSLDGITTGRMENFSFDSDPTYGYIDPFTRYDLTYTWNHQWNGSVSLGVYNLADDITGLYLRDRQTGEKSFDDLNGDPYGRQFLLMVRQKI
jgi:iron complex outermembrane receptor protein